MLEVEVFTSHLRYEYFSVGGDCMVQIWFHQLKSTYAPQHSLHYRFIRDIYFFYRVRPKTAKKILKCRIRAGRTIEVFRDVPNYFF